MPETAKKTAAKPARRVQKKKKVKHAARPAKLRKSLTPGTVLILLSGPFRGRRVVMLKPLTNGLVLVAGPTALNGVPLRRVNAAYVIATSTKIDISGIEIPELNFAKSKNKTKQKEMKEAQNKDRLEKQKALDKKLIAVIKKTPHLAHYLRTKFTLEKNVLPHQLKF